MIPSLPKFPPRLRQPSVELQEKKAHPQPDPVKRERGQVIEAEWRPLYEVNLAPRPRLETGLELLAIETPAPTRAVDPRQGAARYQQASPRAALTPGHLIDLKV